MAGEQGDSGLMAKKTLSGLHCPLCRKVRPLTETECRHAPRAGFALGAGGMGEVFRARDTKLNRDGAIKVLPAAFADDRNGSRGSLARRRPSRR